MHLNFAFVQLSNAMRGPATQLRIVTRDKPDGLPLHLERYERAPKTHRTVGEQ
ncbi:hypothetical protein Terro_3118 [Terriglobus roseus DSM 18391]|uniref:Uncharacterized protein n=1 Tax=Terriglobus roseus (strain DSM 18391 / NRRL B-41598 / KBS 63) TaxID=926566 RepID=I3ZJD0_TERRK|nr:hypothetical protein Terro_3118 [Terriglobus roseus DSM 18391]